MVYLVLLQADGSPVAVVLAVIAETALAALAAEVKRPRSAVQQAQTEHQPQEEVAEVLQAEIIQVPVLVLVDLVLL
jgi:hypothetical protein